MKKKTKAGKNWLSSGDSWLTTIRLEKLLHPPEISGRKAGCSRLPPPNVVTELPWTHNLLILSRCKQDDEREFVQVLCRGGWGWVVQSS
ncbi:MAG: hypothetical protein O3A00_16365 [Planctomycetota bacterium]|nr:hypothetical protein [Planctomycetota bacterium]